MLISMNTIRLSATSARNKFFDILNQVALGREFIIEKDKKEVAVILPKKTKTDWKAFGKALKNAHGILKDYSVEEISPLRKKGAWKNFGEWDKDILVKNK
jgi:antitoxin (DNA-binding transcriptional repressor) of toxin-antitoxin stability system